MYFYNRLLKHINSYTKLYQKFTLKTPFKTRDYITKCILLSVIIYK